MPAVKRVSFATSPQTATTTTTTTTSQRKSSLKSSTSDASDASSSSALPAEDRKKDRRHSRFSSWLAGYWRSSNSSRSSASPHDSIREEDDDQDSSDNAMMVLLDDSDHVQSGVGGNVKRPPFLPNLNGSGSLHGSDLNTSATTTRNQNGGNFFTNLSRELMNSSELLFNNKLNWLLLLGPLALVGDATGFLGEAACFAFSGIALIPCAER